MRLSGWPAVAATGCRENVKSSVGICIYMLWGDSRAHGRHPRVRRRGRGGLGRGGKPARARGRLGAVGRRGIPARGGPGRGTGCGRPWSRRQGGRQSRRSSGKQSVTKYSSMRLLSIFFKQKSVTKYYIPVCDYITLFFFLFVWQTIGRKQNKCSQNMK